MRLHPDMTWEGLAFAGQTPGFGGALRQEAASVAGIFVVWQERARLRCALASLDDRLLDDMGIGCNDARRESGKPFWRG